MRVFAASSASSPAPASALLACLSCLALAAAAPSAGAAGRAVGARNLFSHNPAPADTVDALMDADEDKSAKQLHEDVEEVLSDDEKRYRWKKLPQNKGNDKADKPLNYYEQVNCMWSAEADCYDKHGEGAEDEGEAGPFRRCLAKGREQCKRDFPVDPKILWVPEKWT